MLIVSLLVLNFFATAQLKDVINKAKQKANEKINKAADSSINKKETDPVNNKPAATKDTTQPGSVSIKAYSKYDFVPGEKSYLQLEILAIFPPVGIQPLQVKLLLLKAGQVAGFGLQKKVHLFLSSLINILKILHSNLTCCMVIPKVDFPTIFI